VDDIPLSANGKVDRKKAQLLLTQHVDAQETSLTPPQGETEVQVANVWRALLPEKDIGRESHFFSLGGDSLLATQVISALRERGLSAEQPLRLLFAQPVLADFAAGLITQDVEPVCTLTPDPEARFEPFPLTEIQRAYWMGQSPGLPLNCGTHYLVELDGEDVNIARLENAWNSLVQHHDMLRVVIENDGNQRVLPFSQPIAATCHQFDNTADQNGEHTAKQWLYQQFYATSAKSQNNPEITEQLHHIFVASYRDLQAKTRCRIGIIFNYLTLDGFSIKLFLEQLSQTYLDPRPLPKKTDLLFRDYVNQITPSNEERQKAEKFWTEKLEVLPLRASLPLAIQPEQLTAPIFTRREHRLSEEKWSSLKAKAQQYQFTPSVVLLVAYSEVLRLWNGGKNHSINLTLFDRQPVHKNINTIMGDFTTLSPVGFYHQQNSTLIDIASATQREIADVLENKAISSIWIQRQRSSEMSLTAASLPIVFTSTLGLGNGLFEQVESGFPKMVAGGLSETPQVWLDHQVYEFDGELALSWDSVDDLFPEHMIDEMFDTYVSVIENLIQSDWSANLNLVLPAQQCVSRQATNATLQSRSVHTLHHPFFKWASKAPERTALIAEQTTLSYGELAYRARQLAALLIKQGLKPE
ncbi:condensation domain-containing protein, partial [Enterovibrio norvegicus]